MPTPTAPADRLTGRGWAILLVLSSAIFLEGIDVSMMGVALPSIRADLGLSTSSLQWVVSAYVLGYGGFVLLGGRASDLLGRRRMFVLWLTVFLLFSGLGGLATDGWLLILARFVTGVAAAFMTPAGLSIITTTFPEGPLRTRALLVYAGIAAGGFSLGMVTGGLLTSIDWRWVFFAPVIMAAVILAAAVRLIPHDTPAARAGGGYDVGGTLSLTGAMLLLVYTVVMLPEVDPGSTVTTAAAGLALLALFVTIERRSRTPLLRLGLLRSAPLLRANAGAMLLVGGFVGFQFIAVLYLQEYRGWSETQTGLALMVLGLDAILAPTLTPVLVRRFGNATVIVAGLALAAVAYALFLRVGADWTYAAMLPSFLVLSTAFALGYGPLTIAATDGVAAEEQGLASGVLTTSFQFGSALGLAVVTAVVVGSSGPDGADLDAFRTALLVPLAAALIGVVVTASGLRRRRRRRPAADPAAPALVS
ncbi:MFS transporter [Jiangella sp. DSM 45060]|uniref:MFS transporter n=1 Tax=Jiangella sp. DSM 45060 TaxID=1798224 RepID=UPI000879880D|nr:MFS transporter [Jiangella sp. DSM 45060]SDS00159.1 Predicted arabinose efflux permease, MFS family [Jiangella sp. DSM 45060]